ncbi:hypothetical protein D3C86_1922110 [compost metagenome]
MSLTTKGSAAQPAGLQAAIMALVSTPSEMRLCLINVNPLFLFDFMQGIGSDAVPTPSMMTPGFADKAAPSRRVRRHRRNATFSGQRPLSATRI